MANEPTLHEVKLTLCSACIDGEGDECHTPGCALWMNRPPAYSIRDSCMVESIDGATLDYDTLTRRPLDSTEAGGEPVKHGRPPRGSWDETYDGRGSTRWTEHRLCVGWRREHAHRVWQAMQAVVAVMAIVERCDSIFSDYWDESCRLGLHIDSNATGGGHG